MEQYCYKYPRPEVTADCVVFGWKDGVLQVLLVERGKEPFCGCRALPGGFLNMDESAEACAVRELKEETGLTAGFIRQVGAFTRVDRDPRGRVITVAFYTFADVQQVTVCPGDDAAGAGWFPVLRLPDLAFDHAEILEAALKRMKEDLTCGDLPGDILRKLKPLFA